MRFGLLALGVFALTSHVRAQTPVFSAGFEEEDFLATNVRRSFNSTGQNYIFYARSTGQFGTAQAGTANSFWVNDPASVNPPGGAYANGGLHSVWLSPRENIYYNGDIISFWVKVDSPFPNDKIYVRLSPSGNASTPTPPAVGDFTELLGVVDLEHLGRTARGQWRQFRFSAKNLGTSVNPRRFALHHWIPDATGYKAKVGLDTVETFRKADVTTQFGGFGTIQTSSGVVALEESLALPADALNPIGYNVRSLSIQTPSSNSVNFAVAPFLDANNTLKWTLAAGASGRYVSTVTPLIDPATPDDTSDDFVGAPGPVIINVAKPYAPSVRLTYPSATFILTPGATFPFPGARITPAAPPTGASANNYGFSIQRLSDGFFWDAAQQYWARPEVRTPANFPNTQGNFVWDSTAPLPPNNTPTGAAELYRVTAFADAYPRGATSAKIVRGSAIFSARPSSRGRDDSAPIVMMTAPFVAAPTDPERVLPSTWSFNAWAGYLTSAPLVAGEVRTGIAEAGAALFQLGPLGTTPTPLWKAPKWNPRTSQWETQTRLSAALAPNLGVELTRVGNVTQNVTWRVTGRMPARFPTGQYALVVRAIAGQTGPAGPANAGEIFHFSVSPPAAPPAAPPTSRDGS